MIGLHLGCGRQYKAGFINVDRYDMSVADLMADTAVLPFADDSVDRIEAHHLIEHYPYAQIFALLAEWHRVLRPGGLLVVETPDFEQVMRLFLEDRDGQRWLFWHVVLFGGQQNEGQFHKSPQTFPRLKEQLELIGFGEVRRGEATSSFPGFSYNENMRVEATKTASGFAPPPTGPRLQSALVGARRRISDVYPYQASDVSSFLQLGEPKIQAIRVEFAAQNRYDADLIVGTADGRRAQVWQGFGAPVRDAVPADVEVPAVIQSLPSTVSETLERSIADVARWIQKERPAGSLNGYYLTLQGGTPLPGESTRFVVPGRSTTERYVADARTYQLARELATGKDSLVLSSGVGYGAKMISETATSCVAVDFDKRAVAHATRTYPAGNLEWVFARDGAIDLPGRRFDVVVAPLFLEHVPPPERPAVLRLILGLLKPGGCALVSAHNRFHHDGKYALMPTRGLTPRELALLIEGHPVGRVSYCGQRPWREGLELVEQAAILEGFRPDDDRTIALIER